MRLRSVAIVGLVACGADPVHDREVRALGPEVSGISPGPYHRAGQPCLVCHGGKGPAKAEFSVAGTVFYDAVNFVGAGDEDVNKAVAVILVDSTPGAKEYRAATNCVGNFWVAKKDWDPAYPLMVKVADRTRGLERVMLSQISREGSCGRCHTEKAYTDSPGVVRLVDGADKSFKGAPCPVDPIAGNPVGVGP